MLRGSGARRDDPVDGTLGELGLPSEQQATLQHFGEPSLACMHQPPHMYRPLRSLPAQIRIMLAPSGHSMQGPSGVPVPEPMDERSVPSVTNELTPGDGAGIVVPQGAALALANSLTGNNSWLLVPV